jgi:hypothetical protein
MSPPRPIAVVRSPAVDFDGLVSLDRLAPSLTNPVRSSSCGDDIGRAHERIADILRQAFEARGDVDVSPIAV